MATENLTVVAEMRGDLARDTRAAERAVSRLNDELEDGGKAGAQAAAGYSAAAAAADDLGDESRGAAAGVKAQNEETKKGSVFADLFTKRMLKMAAAVKLFKGIVTLLKLPALAGALAVAAAGVSALTAALTALVGAAGPAVGLLAAIPGTLVAIGGAVGAVKMGFKGFGDALKALAANDAEKVKEAFKDMHPEAQKLARRVHDVGHEMTEMRKRVAGDLMPGVRDGFEGLVVLMPILERYMRGNARVVGHLARSFGDMASSIEWQDDLNFLASRSTRVTRSLGETVLNLADVFRNLMVTAQPLVEWLADGLQGWSGWLAGATAAGRESGRLREFFESTKRVVRGLVDGTADLFVALYNTFRIGSEYGGELGNRLGDLLNKWREWTESVEGQSAIKKWFDDARPVMDALFSLVGAIGDAFRDLATSAEHQSAMIDLLEGLESSLANFMDLVDDVDTRALVDAILALVDAYVNFSDALDFNPFIKVIGGIGDMINSLADLMDKYPVLGTLITHLLTLKTLSFATGLVAQFLGLNTVLDATKTKLRAKARAWVVARAKMIWAATAARLSAVGWWLLNAALAANPIVLVVAAVALLVTALVVLYKRSETFRRIVDRAFSAVKVAALTLAETWIGVFRSMVNFFLSAAEDIVGGAAKIARALGMDELADDLSAAQGEIGKFKDAANRNLSAIETELTVMINTEKAREQVARLGTSLSNLVQSSGGYVDAAVRQAVNRTPGAVGTPRGDTASSRARGRGGLATTLRHHASIDRGTPGSRSITNALVGGGGLGRGSGDHQAGRALDLVGSGLNAYAREVKALGGYAAFHGSGGGRHLHAVYPAGDTARSHAGAARAAAGRSGGGDVSITIGPGAVVVENPASHIDVKRAVAEGIADYLRDQRERAVYR